MGFDLAAHNFLAERETGCEGLAQNSEHSSGPWQEEKAKCGGQDDFNQGCEDSRKINLKQFKVETLRIEDGRA
jgi:hypothetical protein